MATKGVDLLLLVQTGVDETTDTPNLEVIAGQRNCTISYSSETVDVTSKDSGGAQEFEYGLSTWTISADGVYTVDEAGFEALKEAMSNKTKLKARVQYENSPTVYSGDVIVTSAELEAPYDGEMTYACEVQGTGELSPMY
jgi:TP901-1 family phage major tail protein